jgi:tetratricopeptide (TPR) repeat protein
MASYNSAELPLNISEAQKKTLQDLYKSFAQRVDDKKTVEPELINSMSKAMQAALAAQPSWQTTLSDAQAFRHTLLHLLHTDNDMLALPWHIVPYSKSFVHLSKGFDTEGGNVKAFEPEKALPLKILVVISKPDDLTDDEQRLDHETEIEQIIDAFDTILADAQVEIDFANDGTLLTLTEKLAQNAYHILHFSGHGIASKTSGMGYLLMEDDETFKSRNVSAKEFAEVLSLIPENRPELVVLSACQSAKGFDSVTRYLHDAGVPAVVSMNQSILDYFATFFAAALYKNIALHLKSREPLSHSFALAIDALKAEEAKYDKQYGQYLIPQLFTSYHIQNLLNYEQREKHALKFNAVKFVTGEKRMLLEKQQGYTFVGRRREIRLAMPVLQANKAVLLRGQGGVGKTALAEYLIGRLLLNDSKMYPFMLDEKKTNIEDLSNAMMEFLFKDLKKTSVPREANGIEKATDKFWFLFEKIADANRFPLFIFDNLESFQANEGGVFMDKHADLRDLIKDIIEQGCPVILTSRYPVPDFADVTEVNLNEVAFGDFYRKAQTLKFYELRHRLETLARDEASPASMVQRRLDPNGTGKADFKQVLSLLHNTLGGNYRALEFFDNIYQTDSHSAYTTLESLDAFTPQLAQDSRKVREKLQQEAKSLVFDRLIALLSPDELRTLLLLEPFRVPVLPEAVAMQYALAKDKTTEGANGANDGVTPSHPVIERIEQYLTKLFDLTLIEQHEIGDDKAKAYYVAPLVRDYLNQAQLIATDFNHKQAGDYFDKRVGITDNVDDAEEAYHHYYTAADKAQVNLYGAILCRHYFDRQIFRKAYDVGKQTENFVGADTEGGILNNLGRILQLYGQLDAALPYYERNLVQYRATGNQKNEGVTLNNISQIYQARGDYDTALRYLEQSLIIDKELKDFKGEGTTLNNFGLIYHSKGDYDNALRYWKQSLAIQQQIGDRSGEGTTLNNISQIYDAKGDYDTALRYLEQSLAIKQQIGDRSGEGTTLNNISQIYQAQGDYAIALHYLEQSLAIQQQISDRSGEGRSLNNISGIYQARGDYATALRYLEQSLAIRQQIGDRAGLATTLHNMGSIFWEQQQDAASAVGCFVQAYQILTQIGSPNARETESWLNHIKGTIGEEALKAILAAQGGQ